MSLGLLLYALQGKVPGVIENVAKFFDFAPRKTSQVSHNASSEPDGISDVSEREMLGGKAAVDLAVEFLSVR